MSENKCKFNIGWPCRNRMCEENIFYHVEEKRIRETERTEEIGNCLLLNRDTWTLEEIGACWNLSRERIRQIEERAMAKIEKGTLVYGKIYDHIDLSHRLKKKLNHSKV